MQDRELYRRILGIEAPWHVERVELQLTAGEVHVYLDHPGAKIGRARNVAPPPRFMTISRRGVGATWILASIERSCMPAPPRSMCAEQGVRVVKLPWAEAASRFTALLEALAIEWLKEASQKAVARQLA